MHDDLQCSGMISPVQDLSRGLRPQSRRVLLVEDEPTIREYLSELLTHGGYAVDAAPDSLDALLHLMRGEYHCAILDLLLPDVNGLFLHHQIRRVDGELARRTVFITGSEESLPVHARARELRIPILPKPIPTSRLFEVLEAFGDRLPALAARMGRRQAR